MVGIYVGSFSVKSCLSPNSFTINHSLLFACHHYYTGYQRQLNYKHNDGAYSTFGTGVGNTW